MNEEERKLEEESVEYIRTHKKEVLERFCPVSDCHPVENPVSLFMAGSPGAGKTEVSKGLIRRFKDMPVRIDADEIRSICPGYVGTNAHVFQKAATKGVNLLYDHVLKNHINCVMDGTFAYGGVYENIKRSLDHKRKVEIWFVYQDPIRAWEFTKAREEDEARHVSKEVFIKAFLTSRINVRAMKESFGKDIELNILTKDYETDTHDLYLNESISDLDRIVDNSYSKEKLEQLLT